MPKRIRRPHRGRDQPRCVLLRDSGFVFVATLPDLWHGRMQTAPFVSNIQLPDFDAD